MTEEFDRLLPNPDLQQLVEQFGGYQKITQEAWGKYDEQLAATFAWLAAYHKIKDPNSSDYYERVSDARRGIWKLVKVQKAKVRKARP